MISTHFQKALCCGLADQNQQIFKTPQSFYITECSHLVISATAASTIDTHALEQLFRHKVLKLLLPEGQITETTVSISLS